MGFDFGDWGSLFSQFETIESLDTKFLSFQTAVVLTLTSAKWVGDLHALSVHPFCTQFTLDVFNPFMVK